MTRRTIADLTRAELAERVRRLDAAYRLWSRLVSERNHVIGHVAWARYNLSAERAWHAYQAIVDEVDT